MLGGCPVAGCGGQIIEGRKGYGCSHFKSGCKFVIWKEFAGKNISHAMLKSLLTSGKTQLLTFKDDRGGSFKARIVRSGAESGQLRVERESSASPT